MNSHDDGDDDDDMPVELQEIRRLATSKASAPRAIERCTSLADTSPKDFRVWYYRALAHAELGDLEAAVSDMALAAKLEASQPSVFYLLGIWELQLGLSSEGCDHLERCLGSAHALGTDYFDLDSQLMRGATLLKLGRFDEAAAAIQGVEPTQTTWVVDRMWNAREIAELAAQRRIRH